MNERLRKIRKHASKLIDDLLKEHSDEEECECEVLNKLREIRDWTTLKLLDLGDGEAVKSPEPPDGSDVLDEREPITVEAIEIQIQEAL